ncbi:Variant SH3 domain containing protein [Trichomonas vaginalis G3]|uniref:Variant SH3 domain containing protein n=1 Tax=Trichomonas vaginalis (strain ATCC PRA-98 / G3) TaxID=412133 RepID=A2DWW2_TRIV3|nr:peptidyl-tyrosine autophosphorylation [Trichomonas vaginalis G3]EAY15144.1 Variant SH3 domain containing protein [Trichomonas vaginalis G3]KAI5499164.1 peptidyl-tyrosine autophosphorylation [Trichomonas vaginalis G3]|eukprot:XP_001327367.1 Variant SH3 domain containing protein [Trichomonas vaginalis G3]
MFSGVESLLTVFKRISERLDMSSKDFQTCSTILQKRIDIYNKVSSMLTELSNTEYDPTDFLSRSLVETIKSEASLYQLIVNQFRQQIQIELKPQLDNLNETKKLIFKNVDKQIKILTKSLKKGKNDSNAMEVIQIAGEIQSSQLPEIHKQLEDFECNRFSVIHKHLISYADLSSKFSVGQDNTYKKFLSKLNVYDPKEKSHRAVLRVLDPTITESADTEEAYAIAVADFRSNQPADLAFTRGDKIHVLSQHSSGWWEGECNGKKGLFPNTYVTLENSTDTIKSQKICAYFSIDKEYHPTLRTELDLEVGDLVFVEYYLRGRYFGENQRTGHKGSFPESCLTL